MIVLFDSSAWLEYFFGSEIGKKIQPIIEDMENVIIITKINLFEIYYKILVNRNREEAETFIAFILNKGDLDELDAETIKLASEEKKKYDLGMADAIVTATCIKYGAKLYTKDNDFRKVKDIVDVEFLA